MKCLVLGGGGFLGSHLCEGLLAHGHSVRIFDRPNLQRYVRLATDPTVEWVEGDFCNSEEVSQAVPGCDVIYHLVSTTLPKSSNDNPVYDVDSNVIGSLNLFAAAYKSKVKKIVFVSSGGTVYGVPEEIPIQEAHPTNPICSYGISKLTVEKYLELYRGLHGTDYCVLRLANPYGERQRITGAQGAVAVFLHKAVRNEEIEIWGNGDVVRDYVYVGDVVNAFLSVLENAGEPRIFNIGAGVGKSLNELLAAIEEVLGKPVIRKYLPGRSFDVPVNVLDISRAHRYLGWQPKVSFYDGLSRTLQWIRNEDHAEN